MSQDGVKVKMSEPGTKDGCNYFVSQHSTCRCLLHWLSVHSECPICKAAVVSSTQEHCSERETTSLIM